MNTHLLSRYERTRKLIELWLNMPEASLSCDDCANHMDRLVELLLADATPIGIWRRLRITLSTVLAAEPNLRHC